MVAPIQIGPGINIGAGINIGQFPLPTPQYSYRFQGTGAGTSLLSMSPGVTLGAGDFTIEGWIRCNNVNQQLGFYGDGATGALQIYMDNVGSSPADAFQVNYQGAGQISFTTATLASNTWYYFVVVRQAGLENVFLNGTASGATADPNNYASPTIAFGDNYKGSWQGLIFDFRVSNIARYSPTSGSIAVPTAPLTTDANTLVLFDGSFLTGTDASGNQTIAQGGSGTAVSLVATAPPGL
jgi:hypothetical protein